MPEQRINPDFQFLHTIHRKWVDLIPMLMISSVPGLALAYSHCGGSSQTLDSAHATKRDLFLVESTTPSLEIVFTRGDHIDAEAFI